MTEQLGLFPPSRQETRQVTWEEAQWAEGITAHKVNRRRIVYPPVTFRFGSADDVKDWMANQFHRGYARVDNPTEPFQYSMTKVEDLVYSIVVVEWSDW
jgi:hypothetical protein